MGKGTTTLGYLNRNDQKVVGYLSTPDNDRFQRIYMSCRGCDSEYGSLGSDIWQRKCPACQGGKAGEEFEVAERRAATA